MSGHVKGVVVKGVVVATALALLSCSEALNPSARSGSNGSVGIEVQSPERVPYAPSVLGTGPTNVSIVIANHGSKPLDVSKLGLRVEAVRPGLALECRTDGEDDRLEPTVLEPGKNHRFERVVNCHLPFASRYEIRVAVAFGRDGAWRLAKTYPLEVTAPPELAPRLIDERGLVASIGATRLAGNATKRGHPRFGIALTNVGAQAIDLAPLRVETRVHRNDAPWTCTSTAATLNVKGPLESGSVHRESLDVTCLGFEAPGSYDVEVVLLLDAGGELSLGSLPIEIVEDPAFVLPEPIR